MKIVSLPAALLSWLFLVTAAPAAAQGQAAAEPVPARVSPAQFRGLGWLEGAWRGRMPDGTPFHERYTLVDDSTFSVRSFADSTLASPRDIGRVSLRGGAVFREEPSGERVPATRFDPAGVLFGTEAGGFTWAPRPDGSWTATIHRVDGSGARRDVVYRMERIQAATDGADRAGVERAVLDYVEALYEVDPARIERSVHPELAKRGFWRRDGSAPYEELKMSYAELRDLAARWNRSGRVDARAAVKEVVVLDVLDRTASAKLVADWGVDYLHLAKYDGTWRIVNVLWQSPPRADHPPRTAPYAGAVGGEERGR